MSLDAAAYQRAAARFGETIVELADEEWELTTHPDDWTVITTVAWVVVGDAQLSSAAAGEALQSVGEFDAAVLGGNPVAIVVENIGALRGVLVIAIFLGHNPITILIHFDTQNF